MKIDRIRVAGLAATVFVTLIFSIVVIGYEFPIFNSAETVGMEATEFLWTHRLIDLIGQAFVLFAAAACCVVVLRMEGKE